MRHLLPLLPKPSKYLGMEAGSVHKDPDSVSLHVGLAFPDKYEVGMSYLGQKILYGVLNARPDWYAERVFAPDTEAAAVLTAHAAPLCTMESDTPLADLDALGFSVTHELCYTNILYMLDLAGIPLRAEERAKEPGRWPLIMIGGGCALAAEPLAPFADCMLLGEGEAMLPEALEVLQNAKKVPFDRNALLHALSKVPGVYVPEFFAWTDQGTTPLHPDLPRPCRRVVPHMDDAFYPTEQVIPFGAVHNRLALEIGRGCTRGCRFCQAGMTGRPARERTVPALTDLVNRCLSDTGYGELSFLSLSTGDFSALKTLFNACVERCAEEEVSVSLPSLRVGSIDDEIMGRIAGIRRTGATLAPEAGSQRLRDVINKGVTEQELILHVQKLFEHGWQQVKLYFMIGLPSETDEDIEAIVDLARKARDAAGPGIKRLQVTVAVSPFVPKPHTPFQWEEQISLEEIKRRVGILLDAVRKEKRITLRWHDPEVSFLEGIFSRGDRRLADVVERAYRKGAVFASWMEHFALPPWLEAMREEGLDPTDYTAARALNVPLPWDHLENGASREFLLRERDKAFTGKLSGDCRYETCLVCGVCDTKAGPSRLERLPDSSEYRNRLNLPRRDQAAHSPNIDQYGRVVVRSESGKAESRDPGQKKKPPELPEHLTRKAAHLRLWYRKMGLSAYLSQLELQSVFERAFRRAELPLAFSQGFHPLPLLSFSRALPVGVASQGESLCVHLRELRDPAAVHAALADILPGLGVVAVEPLPVGRRPLDAEEEVYRLEYIGGEADKAERFKESWKSIAQCATLPWTRETKKGPREVDAKSYFATIVEEEKGTGVRLALDWSNGYISPLALVLAAMEGVHAPCSLPELRLTKLRSAQ